MYFQASSISSLAVLAFFVVFLAGLRRRGTLPLSVAVGVGPSSRSVTRACAVLELLSTFSDTSARPRCRFGFAFALTTLSLLWCLLQHSARNLAWEVDGLAWQECFAASGSVSFGGEHSATTEKARA